MVKLLVTVTAAPPVQVLEVPKAGVKFRLYNELEPVKVPLKSVMAPVVINLTVELLAVNTPAPVMVKVPAEEIIRELLSAARVAPSLMVIDETVAVLTSTVIAWSVVIVTESEEVGIRLHVPQLFALFQLPLPPVLDTQDRSEAMFHFQLSD